MTAARLRLEIAGNVAELTIDRPSVLNAIDVDTARVLGEYLEEIMRREDIRAVLLRGEGRAFCAGGDMSAFKGSEPHDIVADRTMAQFHPAVLDLASLPVPTVAAVHGAVAGAGIGLMLACDVVFAAEDTHFTLAYPKIGATIDAGASWFLSRAIGVRKAKELAFLSAPFDPVTALDLGLVNRIVAADALLGEARGFAAELADGPTAAFACLKRLFDAAPANSLSEQLDAERATFVDVAAGSDFREGLAAFYGKRAPRFTGERKRT